MLFDIAACMHYQNYHHHHQHYLLLLLSLIFLMIRILFSSFTFLCFSSSPSELIIFFFLQIYHTNLKKILFYACLPYFGKHINALGMYQTHKRNLVSCSHHFHGTWECIKYTQEIVFHIVITYMVLGNVSNTHKKLYFM